MKNRRKAVQPFEIKKRKIDIFRNYEANGFEKNQRKFENFSTLISKKSTQKILAHNQKQYWKINFCGKKTSLKNVSAHHLPLSNKLLITTSVYVMKSISAFVL